MTFQGQDDPEWWTEYQKWILQTGISNIRGIARAYTVKNKKVEFEVKKWPWPWPFKVKMTQNGEKNIRNEFYIKKLVTLEVLHEHIL